MSLAGGRALDRWRFAWDPSFGMELRIREAQDGDLPQLRVLYQHLHAGDPVTTDGRDVAVFEQILAAPHLTLFVGELDQQLVCTCYFNFIVNLSRNQQPYAVIENVVTHRDFRRQGLGQRILRHALDAAWQAGCYKVMLQTGSRRESTHRFYQRCGFSADDKFAFVARPPRE